MVQNSLSQHTWFASLRRWWLALGQRFCQCPTPRADWIWSAAAQAFPGAAGAVWPTDADGPEAL